MQKLITQLRQANQQRWQRCKIQRRRERAWEGERYAAVTHSGNGMGLEEELDALLERLNLAKYKEVMEENEVRGERERALQTEAISNLGVILEISRRGFAEVSGCVD